MFQCAEENKAYLFKENIKCYRVHIMCTNVELSHHKRLNIFQYFATKFAKLSLIIDCDDDELWIICLGPCWRERRARTAWTLRLPGESVCFYLNFYVEEDESV